MGDGVAGRTVAARALALLPVVGIGLLAGCRDHRTEAAGELERLNDAMQQHATQYGSFPETIDSDRPTSRDNLPFPDERRVSVRLIGATSESYAATARSGVWLCGIRVGLGQRAVPDCVPTRDGDSAEGEDLPPPGVIDHIIDEPGAPADTVPEP